MQEYLIYVFLRNVFEIETYRSHRFGDGDHVGVKIGHRRTGDPLHVFLYRRGQYVGAITVDEHSVYYYDRKKNKSEKIL